MSAVASADDIEAGYEALRTQAMGGRPAESPRGLALVLTRGLPAWIRAWAVPPPAPPPLAAAAGRQVAAGGIGVEIVRVLTEMVIGSHSAVVAP